jgi:16S rRNA (cytidine1402-2'-O)-methyltransferase
MAGTLYAVPTPLGGEATASLPGPAIATIRTLRQFVVENAKSARAFLKDVGMPCALQELDVKEIDSDVAVHVKNLVAGNSLGLLSEAGCPAIADPGAALVEAAQAAGIRVVPLVGPSSIVLALMASGLDGQRFAFCGYLPREAEARRQKIRELAARSRRERETQIFIETPYRNDALLASLVETLPENARLCVATDLTLPAEAVRTQSVAAWRAALPAIGKRPTVFLLLSVDR